MKRTKILLFQLIFLKYAYLCILMFLNFNLFPNIYILFVNEQNLGIIVNKFLQFSVTARYSYLEGINTIIYLSSIYYFTAIKQIV